MENMQSAEAREALAAVSVCFGAGMLLALLGSAWGLLILLAGVAGMLWIEFSAKRSVRTAVKQEVREDPKLNWKAAIAPLVAYPVMMLAQSAGTTAIIVMSVLFTVGLIAAYGLTWNKYHD